MRRHPSRRRNPPSAQAYSARPVAVRPPKQRSPAAPLYSVGGRKRASEVAAAGDKPGGNGEREAKPSLIRYRFCDGIAQRIEHRFQLRAYLPRRRGRAMEKTVSSPSSSCDQRKHSTDTGAVAAGGFAGAGMTAGCKGKLPWRTAGRDFVVGLWRAGIVILDNARLRLRDAIRLPLNPWCDRRA